MKQFLLPFTFLFLIVGCQTKYKNIPAEYHSLLDSALAKAGDNAVELQKALDEAPAGQKEGMAFLISYMPERDLTTLSAGFLLTNNEYAYKAREKYSWCAALPDSVFLNEVLPYANISENRDEWRPDFFDRFSKYAEGKDSMVNAVMDIARNIAKEVNVEYNTKRSRVDISPLQAMKENMATCSGLSILLTDAYRAVGIPSRLAGTAMWTNYRGNHTWSEVWINGNWHFIEYYPDTLDRSWFVADAGKADPANMLHWIYAVSYKPTGLPYYAAVDAPYVAAVTDLNTLPEEMRTRYERMKEHTGELQTYIWGYNVTQRYIDLYEESLRNTRLADDELLANVVVFADANTTSSEERVSCRVEVLQRDETIDFGYSPRKTDDMNHFLQFRLKKGKEYDFKVTNPELQLDKTFRIITGIVAQQDVQLMLTQ